MDLCPPKSLDLGHSLPHLCRDIEERLRGRVNNSVNEGSQHVRHGSLSRERERGIALNTPHDA